MVAEYGWSIVFSVWLVYTLGTMLIALGILHVADKLFHKALKSFRLYNSFRQFLLDKYRKRREVITPKIIPKEDD